MRENSATIHPALQHRCPFCHADPGEPCRTRNSGREQDRSHSRRIALTRPIEERLPTPPVDALCCLCGNKRTVSSDYHRRQDPNHSYSYGDGNPEGWRSTQTLKCSECNSPTRHAVLHEPDARWRDYDEKRQRCALGDDDPQRSDGWVQQLRREYRQMPFPRNPYLRHRRWNADAEKAWDDGTKQVIALRGEPMEIRVDPRQADKYRKEERTGYVVPEALSDTEYEDPETGLWWLDMECVDCCRVSNGHRRVQRRLYLEKLLAWYAARPERIDDAKVEDLITMPENLDSRNG